MTEKVLKTECYTLEPMNNNTWNVQMVQVRNERFLFLTNFLIFSWFLSDTN